MALETRALDKNKTKSATNVSAREVGSRHEKRGKKRRLAQAIPNQSQSFFFSFTECDDKDFCLRIFGQPENKITETEKGAKIAPFVCLQRRCLLASRDQKTKTRGLAIV